MIIHAGLDNLLVLYLLQFFYLKYLPAHFVAPWTLTPGVAASLAPPAHAAASRKIPRWDLTLGHDRHLLFIIIHSLKAVWSELLTTSSNILQILPLSPI
jgi:hypothetical protein